LFSKNKSISIKNESQEGSMQSFINPFKGIFNLLNKEVTHYKIDIAGYCELLDLIQKIKGRNKHPYSIKEYDHLFTLEYLQHFSQAETVDFASPRP
jgi:hypothetical protein